jgi:1-acyl-sn-glycerol-3-phosphate acyltransferase
MLVLIHGITLAVVARIVPKYTPGVYRQLCWLMYQWTKLVLRLEIHGMDGLDPHKNYIVTANHQSFADTPLLMALLGGYGHYPRFVMKDSIRYMPILPIYAHHLKFIYLNRHSPRDALKRIRLAATDSTEIQDITLFPEGTRAKFGFVHEPKVAGLYWLMQSFPHHAWVDLTIQYPTHGVHVKATIMPQCLTKEAVESALASQFMDKLASGLQAMPEHPNGGESG